MRGYTLIEILIVVAVIGLTAGIAAPHAQALRRRAAVRATAMEIRAMFRAARSRSIAKQVETGVRFTQGARDWEFAIYEDGDRDGVHTDDIASGKDRRVAAPRPVSPAPVLARVELRPSVAVDPDGDRIKPGASAVQFGTSRICSFSPIGQATPGTIYITDAGGDAWAVRVFGGSARVRLLRYDPMRRKWESQ